MGFGTAESGSTEAADAVSAQEVLKMAEVLARERLADVKEAVKMAEVLAKERLLDIKEAIKMADALARERLADVKEWRSDVQEFVRDLASLKTDVANIKFANESAALEVKDEIRWVRRLLLGVLVTAVLSGVVSSLLVAFGART